MASDADEGASPLAEHKLDGSDAHSGGLRRRAGYLYGLIICGAVLAADPENIRLWLVGVSLVVTALIYWIAETFVHLVASRSTHGGAIAKAELWAAITDGFPLVMAGCVPALVIFIEAAAGVPTPRAVQVALLVNVVLMAIVGWILSPTERPLSPRRFGLAVITALIGIALIELKSMLHH